MLKFFRKYQKIILVVGGCLLMVVFLLPQLPQMTGGGRNTVLAVMGTTKVRYKDYQQANQEIQFLQNISPVLALMVASEPGENAVDNDLWIMRTHEAAMNGLVGGPEDGSGFLQETAVQLARRDYFQFLQQDYQRRMAAGEDMSTFNFAEAEAKAMDAALTFHEQTLTNGYNNLVNQYGSEVVDRALAKARGVLRLFQLYSGATSMSLPEARLYGAAVYDEARADGVIIPASGVGRQPEDYTAQQVQAHFETYRDTDPADNEFGMGYRLSPSVKVEWLKLERLPIQGAVRVDEIELRRLALESPDLYGDRPFNEIRMELDRAYRSKEADRIIGSVVKAMRTAVHRNETESSKEGWRPVPLSDLADIAESELAQDYGMSGLRPRVFVSDDQWKEAEDLPSLGGQQGGIGRAFLPQGAGRVTFPELAMNTLELGDVANPRLGVKAGHIYQPIQDSTGNIYLFRIIEARPEGPPADVSEVEAQVREDLAMLDGYETLAGRVDEFRQRLMEGGVEALATEPGARTVTDGVIGRDRADIGFNYEPLRDAVMDRVQDWDPTVPVADQPMAARTLVMPVPQARGVVALIIDQRMPMTLEEFRTGLAQQVILNQRFRDLQGTALKSPFSRVMMTERLDFEARNRDADADEEDADASAAGGAEGGKGKA